jgi:hypothetical protein
LLAQALRVVALPVVVLLQYLHDVDCPLSLRPDGSDTQAVLQWLINYAVSLEYADAGVPVCVCVCVLAVW